MSETDALLGNHRRSKPSLLSLASKCLGSDLDTAHGDLVLLFCYIITGLLDSSAVLIWGSFVSMQTGNTVYFGLGLIGAKDDRWIKSGVSIAAFCLGSLCFATFHRVFPARRRWVLCASFLAQTVCVCIAALIVTIHPASRDAPLTWLVLVPIALIAFQSSGQAVTSRVLNFTGLTSVVLTSTYCDLFSHPDFLSGKVVGHTEENRRIGAILCLLLGVVLGGLWAHSSVGMMGALWTAAILKSLIVAAWLAWKGKSEEDTE
ncbi:hypothetical protein DTO013E5_5622 [Penicillium roqueforti]|uniref:DUF1275 domain protein n=1 Tax=Penicillium roqueforti (strain FM164) TaxID=1365484 RepID=W6Q9W3_PENRF|nr:uncharacterized protein LCP9604111_8702 [Penicillium roqueforti]XP_057046207.1 uncharacterized protein N7518_003830 [Penicillium psychrosexuale]CDM33205.1 Protein of unknown function DUF1275 [Penicillium roqueforti FM164]KAF9240527.1 hypothetical protein LCP9604111_8702 [Penicillium roqueforti]KAI1830779.1 hypothetical protein CBS147337_8396 [Penicillium roqueforti]KAI2674473.1 hypothetical protein CBS147355_7087 [Penicillium roqueforti]KAI2683867.1 hypothetical protein LCP963914a_5697 [Pe